METRANYVLVGSVVLVVLAALVVFVLWLARTEFSRNVDVYYTYFTGSVAGLQGGSAVRYRGVPVGSVGAVEIDPTNIERIRVTLNLNPGTPIKVDSVASLEIAGITGGSYVEITGGTQSSPALTAPDDQIPVIPSKSSTLASLEEDAPKLIGKLIDLADRANSALSPENVKAITETIDNLKVLSANLRAVTPEVQEAVTNMNKVLNDIHTDLPRLAQTFEADGKAVRETVEELHKTTDEVEAMLTENRGPLREFTGTGLYQLTALATQLRSLTDTLQNVADRLDQDPQRYFFGGGTHVGVDPNRGYGPNASAGTAR
jgi:phospholipid/cholesterol/gamma-HCH transport system substrate-binding protein